MKRKVNPIKSAKVKAERGVTPEQVAAEGEFIIALDHPKDSDQQLLITRFQDYVWVVVVGKIPPRFVTTYPCSKFNKRFKK